MIKFISIVLFLFLLTAAYRSGHEPVSLQKVDGNLAGAVSLSITPEGLIYIAEHQRHRFLVLNRQGNRTDSLGAQGSGDYRFDGPVSVQATNGLKIYVSDLNNNRVQLFDRRHQFLSSVTAEKVGRPARFTPAHIAVNRSNELFIYDSSRHVIYLFDLNGNFRRELDLRPYRLDSVSKITFLNSTLLLLDSQKGVVHRFDDNGGYQNFIGGFDGAASIHGEGDHIWVVFPARIARLTGRGSLVQNFPLEREYSFTDLSVDRNTIYLLTAKSLYKTTAE